MKQTKLFLIPVLILAWLFPTAMLAGADPKSDLVAAEQLYRQGDYSAAAERYQGIIQSGWTSGEVHFNLGSCYYKTGRYGLAILHYERAKLLLGNDPDLEFNLRLANLNVPDRIEPLPRFFVLRLLDGIAGALPTSNWAAIAIASEWILLASLLALLGLRSPDSRRWVAGLFFAAAMVLLASGGIFLQQNSQRARNPEAVVLVSKVGVNSAPEGSSTELFALHEGVKFRILRRVPGWAEIHLADGKRGWMPDAAFETVSF